jgi:hypothetical protein
MRATESAALRIKNLLKQLLTLPYLDTYTLLALLLSLWMVCLVSSHLTNALRATTAPSDEMQGLSFPVESQLLR